MSAPESTAGNNAANSPAAAPTAAPSTGTNGSKLTAPKNLAIGALVAVVAAVGTLQVLRADSARSATAAAPAADVRPPVARVNGDLISFQEVADECVARYGAEVLDNLVNRKLIAQACEKAGVSVSNGEISKEVAEQAVRFNLLVDTWYQMMLSERKLTATQYHRDVIWPMLALEKLAGQNVQVTDADMQRAFERDYGPRVKARMILIDGNQRQAARVWEQATANPDTFDKLAREHSSDPNSRPLGGVIPPIRRHVGSPQFEQAAFALAAGEISDLVQLADGQWVILKGEGRTEPVVTNIDDVYTELRKQQQEEKTQSAVAQVFEEIREGAQVINHLTGTATGHAKASGASGVIRQVSGTPAGNVIQAK